MRWDKSTYPVTSSFILSFLTNACPLCFCPFLFVNVIHVTMLAS